MKYILPSRSRGSVIGKYLVALTASLAASQEKKPRPIKNVSAWRQQRHVLYLLHDFLHHSRFHEHGATKESTIAKDLQPHLADLCTHAAAHPAQTHARHHRKLAQLLNIWEQSSLCPAPYVQSIRDAVTKAGKTGTTDGLLGASTTDTVSTTPSSADDKKKAVPYVLPAYHGDPSAPYYELPAANLIPHIARNSGRPINTQAVRALPLSSGLAPTSLASAVAAFLADVEHLYEAAPGLEDEDDGIALELDEMGQPLPKNRMGGGNVSNETYYGWSRAFCERMKEKKRGGGAPVGRRRSPSSASERSRSPRKRARYSSDDDSSRSRSHSPSRNRLAGRQPSYSRSRSRPRGGFGIRDHGRDRDSESYSPPPHLGGETLAAPAPHGGGGLPFPMPFPNGMPPLGPDGMPLPPPPPPNWQGPWPPPPPPLLLAGAGQGEMQPERSRDPRLNFRN